MSHYQLNLKLAVKDEQITKFLKSQNVRLSKYHSKHSVGEQDYREHEKVAAFDVQADVHYDVFMFFPFYSKCFDKELWKSLIGNFPSYRRGLNLARNESLLFGRIQGNWKDAIRSACDTDLKTGFLESHIKLPKYKS